MTTSADPHTATKSLAIDEHWKQGRLVVYTSGDDAGLMRLDFGQAEFETRDELEEGVRLTIPGESSPLSALRAEGEDGRYVLSFFSSDIANAGHLPATALASWKFGIDEKQMKLLPIISAAVAADEANMTMDAYPGQGPADAYPRTVIYVTVIALIVAALCGLALLVWM